MKAIWIMALSGLAVSLPALGGILSQDELKSLKTGNSVLVCVETGLLQTDTAHIDKMNQMIAQISTETGKSIHISTMELQSSPALFCSAIQIAK